MVNVKKCITLIKYFVIILTLSPSIISCSSGYQVTKIEGKQININDKAIAIAKYEQYLAPYRDRINKDLDDVLAYNPTTLDKNDGEWQTPIGDLLAEVTLKKANEIFYKRTQKNIDICLLNHGGIRAILPKGNVTLRNAFEIMPFENTSIVVALKGTQIEELAQYIIAEKTPHPIAGITFSITKDNKSKNIKVNNKNLELEKIYYVVSSDYLTNGGGNITFFKKGVESFDLDYKLRNILIDYFKDVDTITTSKEIKITKEI
jgi:2',3'-cyclic-nucleotide 2'-phosphodiesterase (5'-nucleotidase family)